MYTRASRGSHSKLFTDDCLCAPIIGRFEVVVAKEELESFEELRENWKRVRATGMVASEKLSALQGGFKKGLMEGVREFVAQVGDMCGGHVWGTHVCRSRGGHVHHIAVPSRDLVILRSSCHLAVLL